MARREFLIAPVLTDLLHYTQATLNIVTQDLNLYRIPTDLDNLLRILIQILEPLTDEPST